MDEQTEPSLLETLRSLPAEEPDPITRVTASLKEISNGIQDLRATVWTQNEILLGILERETGELVRTLPRKRGDHETSPPVPRPRRLTSRPARTRPTSHG